MSTSLISLCEKGLDLPSVERSQIQFPESGEQNLISIEETHFWFVIRTQIVLRLLKSNLTSLKGARGLDIGCGTGHIASYLTQHGYATYGVDGLHSFSAVQNKKKAAGFTRGDIFSIEPEPEFDFALLLDVLEHIPDDTAFLAQSLRFLKPGGTLIISVPAFPILWSKIDDYSQHQRRYTKKTMNKLIINATKGSDLRIKKQFYFYGTTVIPYVLVRKLGTVSTQIQTERSPSNFINHFLLMLLEAESRLISLGGLPFGSSLFTVVKKL